MILSQPASPWFFRLVVLTLFVLTQEQQQCLGFVTPSSFLYSTTTTATKTPTPRLLTPPVVRRNELVTEVANSSSTRLYVLKRIGRFFKRGPPNEENNDEKTKDSKVNKQKQEKSSDTPPSLNDTTQNKKSSDADKAKPKKQPKPKKDKSPQLRQHASVCVVGGGVSGLTAALTCANQLAASGSIGDVVLLEASSQVGGRVISDTIDDGSFTLDRGFAVFIEEYPQAQKLLDYQALQLGKFLPGALIKLPNDDSVLVNDQDQPLPLARVADPLREPGELWTALAAPVGSLLDKIGILWLVLNVRWSTIEQLFAEEETSTLEALRKRWNFSEEIIERFFKPFLEGIYLAPLEEQSSRMFSFVFKMFSEGSASLPAGGIGAVAQQLKQKAVDAGVEVRLDQTVTSIEPSAKNKQYTINIKNAEGRKTTTTTLMADCVIIATEGPAACRLISQIDGFESLQTLPSQVQRFVGNLYYSLPGEPPVKDPILILNGMGGSDRGSATNPVNNVCFPSSVASGYAPPGYSLCSVTVLKDAMDQYQGKDAELDSAVRKQLGTWFPAYQEAIQNTWELKAIYRIPNAQPGQYKGPFPANVHGGRPSNTYRNKELPAGLFVCGDHMSTATLNGALESGVAAGTAAVAATVVSSSS
ncbi:hypothetical protein ACA910_020998 [Epithemia clementina (nom. ined.)]